MMKEEYTKPEVKVDDFQTVDVITTSGGEGYSDNNTDYDL